MSYYEAYSVAEPVIWKAYDNSYSLYDSDGRPYNSNAVALHASMCCENCAQKVRKSLKNVDDVDSVDIDIGRQKVVVRGHVNPGDVLRRVQKQNKTARFWGRSENYANSSSEDLDYHRPTSSYRHYDQSPAGDYAIYISGSDDYHRSTSSYAYSNYSPSYDYVDSYPRSTEYSRHDHYDDRYPSSSEYPQHNDYRSYRRTYDARRSYH